MVNLSNGAGEQCSVHAGGEEFQISDCRIQIEKRIRLMTREKRELQCVSKFAI
jgi:hypothetical protein